MNLISGIQTNYLLKNMPTSIALNLINNCKRYIKTRGSNVYKEGEAFDGRLNLLLSGDVQICKRYEIIATDNCELIENRETSHLFAPRVDYSTRPIGNRKSGDFIERDLIQITGRRNHSAYVSSEAALVLSIDVNLLLAVDTTFSLINNISEIVIFQQGQSHEVNQRIRKLDLKVSTQHMGSEETAMKAKLSYDPKEEDHMVKEMTYGAVQTEKSAKMGFNTLISRVSRTKDRSVLSSHQQKRAEITRISNSPALNRTIQEEPDPKKKNLHRSFQISKSIEKTVSRDSKDQQEKERIKKVVLDSLDSQDKLRMSKEEGYTICKQPLSSSSRSRYDHQEHIQEVPPLQKSHRSRDSSTLRRST